jgi:CRISPR/Cas system-associated endonuclease/helicase Cas3
LWEGKFTSAIQKCFKRIRITKTKEDSKSHQLMEKRKLLRIKLKGEKDIQSIEIIQSDINSIESQLSSLLAEENLMKIKDNQKITFNCLKIIKNNMCNENIIIKIALTDSN